MVRRPHFTWQPHPALFMRVMATVAFAIALAGCSRGSTGQASHASAMSVLSPDSTLGKTLECFKAMPAVLLMTSYIMSISEGTYATNVAFPQLRHTFIAGRPIIPPGYPKLPPNAKLTPQQVVQAADAIDSFQKEFASVRPKTDLAKVAHGFRIQADKADTGLIIPTKEMMDGYQDFAQWMKATCPQDDTPTSPSTTTPRP